MSHQRATLPCSKKNVVRTGYRDGDRGTARLNSEVNPTKKDKYCKNRWLLVGSFQTGMSGGDFLLNQPNESRKVNGPHFDKNCVTSLNLIENLRNRMEWSPCPPVQRVSKKHKSGKELQRATFDSMDDIKLQREDTTEMTISSRSLIANRARWSRKAWEV